MIALLSRLLRPRNSRNASHLRFTVYTREGCGCCDKALAVLEAARRRHGYTIELVDIDTDPDLRARYDTAVPVVAVDGKVRFKGLVNPVLLDRILWAEGRDAAADAAPSDGPV